MITWPVSESSWPVGSSARSSFGPVGERPGDRDPLLLAARQLVRPVLRPLAQADERRAARAPGRRARARSAWTRRSGTSTFSAADRIGTSPNAWKMNATGPPPDVDELVLVHRARPRGRRRRRGPDVGRSSPPSRLSSVVLPLPDRPRTATSSPGATARLIAPQGVDDGVARPGSRGRGRSPRRAAGRCRAARRRPTRTAASSSVVARGTSEPAAGAGGAGAGLRAVLVGPDLDVVVLEPEPDAVAAARAPRRAPAAAAAGRPGRGPRTPR